MIIIMEPYYQKVILKIVKDPSSYLTKKYKDISYKGTEAMTIMENGRIYIILSKCPTADCIAHEAFHAVHFCLSSRGVTLDEHGEAYAYSLGKLVELITNRVRNKNKRKYRAM